MDMEVGPASIGLLAVRALSGAPPGKRAVEKIDLPGEETVAAHRLKKNGDVLTYWHILLISDQR